MGFISSEEAFEIVGVLLLNMALKLGYVAGRLPYVMTDVILDSNTLSLKCFLSS
jgi:hypothetical protein